MAESNANSSVAAVAIVLLVLVGLFAFFLIFRGTAEESPPVLDVQVENPLREGG